MLQPGEVGIARRRCAVLPTVIAAQQRAAPITDVEWRVGDDEVGFQVFVSVVEKGAFVVLFHLRRINAAYGEVHLGQPPGGLVTLLPVDEDVVDAAWCSSTNFFDCTNMPPDPQQGSNTRPL